MEGKADPSPGVFWRIFNFPLTRLVLLYCALLYVYVSGFQFLTALAHGPLRSLGASAVIVANLLFVYASFVRFVERRPVRELALPRMGRETCMGVLLGAGLYTSCVLVAMALGLCRIEGLNDWKILLPTLWMAPLAPVFEELVFRPAASA
jgi:hypothetical protein